MTATAPHDLFSERQVLASVFTWPDSWEIAADILSLDGSEFFSPSHQAIWAACAAVAASRRPLTTSEVSAQLGGKSTHLGALLEATADLPEPSALEPHCRRVKDRAAMRAVIVSAQRLIASSEGCDDDAGWLDRAERALSDATSLRYEDGDMVDANAAVQIAFAELSSRAARGTTMEGVPCGLVDLDKQISGWAPGRLYLICGRPGIGKSVLAQEVAIGIARSEGNPVAVFSLEMPTREWVDRAISAASGIPYTAIASGNIRESGWSKFTQAAGDVSELNFDISDKPGVTVEYISRWSRRMRRKHGSIGAIVVDYLQLMRSATKHHNREAEVSEQSKSLKVLAKELECPVIVVCQVNRACESRPDKRPQLSDIRESGSLEQDADVVMFVYRDEVYNPETLARGVFEVGVAKQRGGPTGIVKLQWRSGLMSVGNLDTHHG